VAAHPGPLYIDASAFVKVYVPEADSRLVERLMQGRRDLVVSDLCITETISALARQRREGLLGEGVDQRAYLKILDHREAGLFLPAPLTTATHREAERLLLSIEGVALRAADALNLALATTSEAAAIIAFDQRLRQAAGRIGLAVLPPAS
jgi:predicted nucleic acid-binding protein